MNKLSIKQLRTVKCSFTFISLITLLAITCVTAVANAQETTPTTTPDTTEPVAVVTTEADAPIQSPNALTPSQQTRVRNLAANISNQLDVAALRFENIINRLESRITIITEQGVDTTNANESLQQAKNKLATIQSQLDTIDEVVAQVVSGANPTTAWNNARTIYMQIFTDLQETKAAIQTVLTTLRTPVVPADTEPAVASSSESN